MESRSYRAHADIDDPELIFSYSSREGGQREVRVNINELKKICLENSQELPLPSTFAVSAIGLNLLRVGGCGSDLDDVGLLQIAMTTDPQVPDDLKRNLLFGLLLSRGLRVIREKCVIVAPLPELGIPVVTLRGSVSFLEDVDEHIPTDAPDITSLCPNKFCPIYQQIAFILSELKSMPLEESFRDSFRLKTYSSVMNKLFYRGKELSDLFAHTFLADSLSQVYTLKQRLLMKGAMLVREEGRNVNGIGRLVYRFVRILLVHLVGYNPFTFPVYYELARESHQTFVPHEQYEWARLEYGLQPGQTNIFKRTGFTVDELSP
jgi:hypothetical protein